MEKNLDRQGRWRNRTVAFRVSEGEAVLINQLVSISGLTKQDYILNKLVDRDVVVYGNPKVYKALRNQMKEILEELKRIDAGQALDANLIDLIRFMAEVMNGMKEESEWK